MINNHEERMKVNYSQLKYTVKLDAIKYLNLTF